MKRSLVIILLFISAPVFGQSNKWSGMYKGPRGYERTIDIIDSDESSIHVLKLGKKGQKLLKHSATGKLISESDVEVGSGEKRVGIRKVIQTTAGNYVFSSLPKKDREQAWVQQFENGKLGESRLVADHEMQLKSFRVGQYTPAFATHYFVEGNNHVANHVAYLKTIGNENAKKEYHAIGLFGATFEKKWFRLVDLGVKNEELFIWSIQATDKEVVLYCYYSKGNNLNKDKDIARALIVVSENDVKLIELDYDYENSSVQLDFVPWEPGQPVILKGIINDYGNKYALDHFTTVELDLNTKSAKIETTDIPQDKRPLLHIPTIMNSTESLGSSEDAKKVMKALGHNTYRTETGYYLNGIDKKKNGNYRIVLEGKYKTLVEVAGNPNSDIISERTGKDVYKLHLEDLLIFNLDEKGKVISTWQYEKESKHFSQLESKGVQLYKYRAIYKNSFEGDEINEPISTNSPFALQLMTLNTPYHLYNDELYCAFWEQTSEEVKNSLDKVVRYYFMKMADGEKPKLIGTTDKGEPFLNVEKSKILGSSFVLMGAASLNPQPGGYYLKKIDLD